MTNLLLSFALAPDNAVQNWPTIADLLFSAAVRHITQSLGYVRDVLREMKFRTGGCGGGGPEWAAPLAVLRPSHSRLYLQLRGSKHVTTVSHLLSPNPVQ